MRNILIVEDILETRQWLHKIVLIAFPGCHVDECATMRAGIASAALRDFDLALVDLGLPDGSGLEVLRNLQTFCPQTICVVTSVSGTDENVVAALAAGAKGYLLKEQTEAVLVRQLTQLADGIPPLSPSIAQRVLAHFRYTGPLGGQDTQDGKSLTAREQEVLTYIARGLRIVDVAEVLKLSENTVASYIKSIYRKLGISSRAEAALHANRIGLLQKKESGERE